MSLSHACDDDYWSNGNESTGVMLRDMSPQVDTQREVVAMFWTRMEKVVKVPTKSPLLIRFVTCDQLAQVLVEEPNRPNIQVTFEKVLPRCFSADTETC